MNMKSLLSRLALIALFLLPNLTLSAQAEATAPADLDAGKVLFRNYCATCHVKNMVSDLTGPALGGVQERWAEFPEEDLYRWIRASAAMIDEGHPRATELWNTWKPTVMNNFPQLTDQEIKNILGYIDGVYTNVYPVPVPGAAVAGNGATARESGSNAYLYWILALVLAALAVILARIISNMNYMLKLQEGEINVKRRSIVQILTSKGVIAFVIFALVVLGGYTTVNKAIMLGRQQGYAPEQPIKFSHETHSGINKIECQYCHDGARRSKSSVIPAANTCMNCHAAIKVGSSYGTAELTKIYASIGWDPNEDSYIEDYENMSRSDIKRIYEKWIANSFTTLDDELKPKGKDIEEVVKDQWEGIVSALTNKATADNKIAGPIEWVRIHNMPDHVYFNHAQHVSVGKVACQTCHGPVEEMEVVQQYSPLSMGWCINCHRETQVQFEGNEYYKSYKLYHEQIKAGTRDGVTVEEIGGLECQKCHY
jgi:cytochrome c2